MNVIFFAINKTLGRTHDETLTTWFIYKQDALLGVHSGYMVSLREKMWMGTCYLYMHVMQIVRGPCSLSLDNSNESFYAVGI